MACRLRGKVIANHPDPGWSVPGAWCCHAGYNHVWNSGDVEAESLISDVASSKRVWQSAGGWVSDDVGERYLHSNPKTMSVDEIQRGTFQSLQLVEGMQPCVHQKQCLFHQWSRRL